VPDRGECLARRLWELWQQGERPALAEFLAGAGALDPVQLGAVVRVDQRQRWLMGEPVLTEQYLQAHPELGREGGLDVAYAEFVLRKELGLAMPRHAFLERFPQFATELRMQIDLGEAVAPSTTDARADPSDHPSPPVTPVSVPPQLEGYEILDLIGGNMGMVYRARHRQRNAVVALKTLPVLEPAALYRFKQEFLVIADITHRNLVNLYELVVNPQACFFTMELVEGVDFLTHVRPSGHVGTVEGRTDPFALEAPAGELSSPTAASAGMSRLRLDRLRAALPQLVAGVCALHSAGVLHRDIKPSNVMVTPEGRVVVLDFGLATTLDAIGKPNSTELHLVGTAAYMAPEQAEGQPVRASDWYSVGVMLYQALTGRLPFPGTAFQILASKRVCEPPPPRSINPEIPADLDTLCVSLTRMRPEDRPSGDEVWCRLSGASSERSVPVAAQPVLLGRESHLATLREALANVRAGRPVTLFAHGPSGVGKSALMQHFLDTVAQSGDAVVLTGRCYEREAVPFKALDSLVDALSRYLRRLSMPEAQALLPREVQHLARLFPVLQRVEVVAQAPGRPSAIVDAHLVRRRASTALRELLARLADRSPAVVLLIDDLQWGDLDSAVLVSDLLRPPDAPVLLVLGCYRSEDQEASPFLRYLFEAAGKPGALPMPQSLAVDTLYAHEACQLAMTLLGPTWPDLVAAGSAIAQESGGNPFFVYELVQHVRVAGPLAASGSVGVRLDDVIWQRVQQLPEAARRLLELVAVCGGPLRLVDAARTLGEQATAPATLAVLRAGRLLRRTAASDQEAIETYHDRIRQTIVARLSADALRQYHLMLATAFEAVRMDPEVLALHFRGAQEFDRAGRYLLEAAEHADESLAFDHAADLYRQALEHPPQDVTQTRRLRLRLGDALANAGRGAEAAAAYLMAAQGASAELTIELRHRAARQYFISGHLDQGLPIFATLLQSIGMRLPASKLDSILGFVWPSIQMAWQLGWWRARPRFHPRDIAEVPPGELMRLEVCWSAILGFSLVDPLIGMYFSMRAVLAALRAGEPCRIAQCLAVYGAFSSSIQGRNRARVARLIQAAEAVLPEGNHPYEGGLVLFSKGAAAFLVGDWQQSIVLCDRAEDVFRNSPRGVSWELNIIHSFALWSLTYRGDVAELTRRWRRLREEARERGDRYAQTILGTHIMSIARLAADEVEDAQNEVIEVIGGWSRHAYHVQHHNALLAQVHIHLYNGAASAAWSYVSERSRDYARSRLPYIQQLQVEMFNSRARSALALAAELADPQPLLRMAARDARRLERQKVPWVSAWAQLIRAGIASVEGNEDGARRLLSEAAAAFDAADMRLWAAAARRRLGQLQGGDEGHSLIEHANRWMTDQGVRRPDRIAAMYAPGFCD
jgi:serine/threonine protein kinase